MAVASRGNEARYREQSGISGDDTGEPDGEYAQKSELRPQSQPLTSAHTYQGTDFC
jgi:hypothetical protein